MQSFVDLFFDLQAARLEVVIAVCFDRFIRVDKSMKFRDFEYVVSLADYETVRAVADQICYVDTSPIAKEDAIYSSFHWRGWMRNFWKTAKLVHFHGRWDSVRNVPDKWGKGSEATRHVTERTKCILSCALLKSML